MQNKIKIPSFLLFNLEKAFIHETTYTTKKGKVVHRKAYTDKRIAKKVVAKDRIRSPWTKNKTYGEVKEKLHNDRDALKKKLEEVRKHKQDLIDAKSKGHTHTEKGISVDHEHHLDKHEKNLHEKLENTNHKIMLHDNHHELLREKNKEVREKAKAKRAEKRAAKKPQEKTSDGLTFSSNKDYMDWYRKQSEQVKDDHKLNRVGDKLVVTVGSERAEVKKDIGPEKKPVIVAKKEEIKEYAIPEKKSEVKTKQSLGQLLEKYYSATDKGEKAAFAKLARAKYMQENPKASMSDYLKVARDAKPDSTTETIKKKKEETSKGKQWAIDNINSFNIDSDIMEHKARIKSGIVTRELSQSTIKGIKAQRMSEKAKTKIEYLKTKGGYYDNYGSIKSKSKNAIFWEDVKSEAEKEHNRSMAMQGNKNAYKGGPKEEPKKIRPSKKVEVKKQSKTWSPLSEDDLNKKYPYGKKQEEIGYNTADAAKRIRQDVKDAIKKGDLPEGLKTSIRKRHHSAINIEIKGLPSGITAVNPYREKFIKDDYNTHDIHREHPAFPRYTKETASIRETLNAIMEQYNFDKSDPMTDYYNTNFYGSVDVDYDLTKKEKENIAEDLKQGKHSEVEFHSQTSYSDKRPESIEKDKVKEEEYQKYVLEKEKAEKLKERKPKLVLVKKPINPAEEIKKVTVPPENEIKKFYKSDHGINKPIKETTFKQFGSWTGEGKSPINPTKRNEINNDVATILKNKSPGMMSESDKNLMRQYSGFGGVKAQNEKGVLYDYFTSPPVAKMALQMLDKAGGVKADSSILEPSCGTGVFFDIMGDGHKKTGVELDSRTAGAASVIHQGKADIFNSSFEEFNLHNKEKFDHVVGNAPFGDRSVSTSFLDMPGEKNLDKYFLERSLDNLKPGGTMAMIVHPGVMDGKKGKEWRTNMLKKGQFLGAVRLPNSSFSHTHTAVNPDVIFFKKHTDDISNRLNQLDSDGLKNVGAIHSGWVDGTYYKNNADNVLGEKGKGNFGADIVVGKMSHSDMDSAVSNFKNEDSTLDIGKLNAKTTDEQPQKTGKQSIKLDEGEAKAVANKTLRVGETKVIDGVTYVLNANHRWERVDGSKETAEKLERVKQISVAIKGIREGMQTDSPVEHLQTKARELIDSFKKDFGTHQEDDKDIKRLINKNSNIKGVFDSLNVKSDSDILTKPNIYHKEIELKDGHNPAVEALRHIQKNMKGADEQTVRAYFPNQADDLIREMYSHKDIFLNDKGEFTVREHYLTGNAYDKMDSLDKAISESKDKGKIAKWETSKEELKKAVGWVSIEDAEFKAYNNWIPEETVKKWVQDDNGLGSNSSISKDPETKKWAVDSEYAGWEAKRAVYYMNMQKQRERHLDTAEFNAETDENFKRWIANDETIRDDLESKYNRMFNSELGAPTKTYAIDIDGWRTTPDKDGHKPIVLNPWQWQSIHHLYENGKGISALGVGYGKTLSTIGLIALLRQEGKTKRPFIQVPNNKVKDWIDEIGMAMPGLKVGSIDPEKKGYGNKANRQKWYQELANNDYDVIILPESAASEIKLTPENDEKISDRISSQQTSKKLRGKSARKQEQIKETADAKLVDKGRSNKTITFEDLGCDSIFIDEAHNYKNLFKSGLSRELGITGVNIKDSQRALSLFKKNEYIRGKNGGKNVFMLTATPMSNSPLEYYNMLMHVAPEQLSERGITDIDDFIKEYADIQTMDKYNWQTGQLKEGKVLKGFHRLDALRDVFFKNTDFQNDPTKIGLEKPKASYTPNVIEADAKQSSAMKELKDKMEEFAKLPTEDRAEQFPGENHLTFYGKMRAASLDLELLDPQKYKGWVNPKVEKMSGNTWDTFQKTGAGQVVFCDRVMSGDKSFNMHDKLKQSLIDKGFKPEEIVVVNGTTKSGNKQSEAAQEKEISAAIDGYNSGKYKVIVGTTQTLGEGVNLQTNSSAVHHVDVPFKPSDIIQRNGRVDRQGNKQKNVQLHNYMTSGTIDNYSIGIVQNKSNWIDDLLNSKSNVFMNENDDQFFDTDGLMLALTEEFGSKEDSGKLKEKMKEQRLVAEKKKKQDKAHNLFTSYATMKGAVRNYKGDQANPKFQARLRRMHELEESLSKNTEFKYGHLLGKDAPDFVYDKANKKAYRDGDVFTGPNGIYKINEMNTAKNQFKAEMIHDKDGLSDHQKHPVNYNGKFPSYDRSNYTHVPEARDDKNRLNDLKTLYKKEDFDTQSDQFKRDNYKAFTDIHNESLKMYKDKDGKVKYVGKYGNEGIPEGTTHLIPGVDDDKIVSAMKDDKQLSKDIQTFTEKKFHSPKMKEHFDKEKIGKYKKHKFSPTIEENASIDWYSIDKIEAQLNKKNLGKDGEKIGRWDVENVIDLNPKFETSYETGKDGEFGKHYRLKKSFNTPFKVPSIMLFKPFGRR